MKDALGSARRILRASRPAWVRCASSEITMMCVPLAVGLLRVDIFVELVDQAEEVAVVFFQPLLQIVA